MQRVTLHEHLTGQATKTVMSVGLKGHCEGIVPNKRMLVTGYRGPGKGPSTPHRRPTKGRVIHPMIGKGELLLCRQADYMVQWARSIPCIVQEPPAIGGRERESAEEEEKATTQDRSIEKEADTLSIT